MNIGLIGQGSIGQFLIRALNEEQALPHCRITSIFDARGKANANRRDNIAVHTDLEAFLESNIQLVIEAATISVVEEYALSILQQGKSLLLLSVGALANHEFLQQLEQVCQQTGARILVPSGAIAGLDALQAISTLDPTVSVTLTTRKSPLSLGLENVSEEKVIFSGSAAEAIQLFPKNINVSIILALAGLGAEKTKVNIVADPASTSNIHQIEVQGEFGQLSIEVQNSPMPTNPKTSYLAALSALTTLKRLTQPLVIG